MSNAANLGHHVPHETSSLARDLTAAELRSAPLLASIDALVIDELSADEDDAFAAALDS